MPRIKTDPNLAALLDTIAWSEGTSKLGDDGYNVLCGGRLFTSYADHPRQIVHIRPVLSTTAAGRYQLLARYFDVYKEQLHLPDFGPISQDMIAIQQIRECRAIEPIWAGNFATAVALCARIWASLPGAGYGQRENTLADLNAAYIAAGGRYTNG